eukprot:g8153.t1
MCHEFAVTNSVPAFSRTGVTCLEFCAKNQMLLSAGFDNYICIWDPSAGTLSFKLTGHECSITGLCKMPETDFEFMSLDYEGVVRLWDVRRLCCIQNFHATDRRAEEAGELERLEPRALCALSRDRVVISGRRRNRCACSLLGVHVCPRLLRTLEIVTPIKNDLYVWDALTGLRLQIHDNVIESNITAITFGLKERRIFVGSEDGNINCINAACGAKLKVLTPHAYEVTQIECMHGKVLTLSGPEKVINVHDDTGEKKALLLKRIDLGASGPILRFATDYREMIVITSEDGDVSWYSTDFAKGIADTSQCSVNHSQAVYCCEYFKEVPLIVTTDTGSAIFWSVPPLRAYDFFNKISFDLPGSEDSTRYALCGVREQDGFDDGFDTGSLAMPAPYFVFQEAQVSISSMCLSWPDECKLFVGTDRGEILRRKESGEAAEVISGRIFDSLPRPVNSPEYVFTLESNWKVEKAHSLSVESIFFCQRQPSVLMTLGADNCLRIWDHATGEPLGSLEQGLPEGLIYERSTEWSFPLDPYLQIQSDTTALIEASEVEMGEGDAGDTKLRTVGGRSLSENQTMPSGRQMEDHITELVKKDRRRSLLQSSSCPALASKGKQLSEFLAAPTQDGLPDLVISAESKGPKDGGGATKAATVPLNWPKPGLVCGLFCPKLRSAQVGEWLKSPSGAKEAGRGSPATGEVLGPRPEEQRRAVIERAIERPVLRAKEVSWQSSAMVAPGLKIDDSESRVRGREEIRALKIPMDVISYSVALRAAESSEMAKQFMSEMQEDAIMADNVVYGAAVGACDRNQDLPLALRFLENMKLSALQPETGGTGR